MQAANDATSCMLIRAAGATGKPTYEALAEWAGGKAWKVSLAGSSTRCNLGRQQLHLCLPSAALAGGGGNMLACGLLVTKRYL